MKRVSTLALASLCVAVLLFGANVFAKEAGMKKTAMSKYLVISPHTAEECMKTMDACASAGTLAKWDFGCKDGDHTGYLITMASSSEEALKMVPDDLRDKARAVKVHRFTPAELKTMHASMH